MDKKELNNVLGEFRQFYRNLPNKESIFYMFFTTDLLFWARKSLTFVPDDVNLIIVCAGLSEEEMLWVRENIFRPVFYINSFCDDRDIWDILFRANDNNFGWLDIDCFVFNKNLFYEIERIDDHTAINAVWTCGSEKIPGVDFVNTHFLYLNIKTIKILREMGMEISPRTYIYRNTDAVPFTRSELVRPKHLKLLEKRNIGQVYPDTIEHLHFFDTLQLYQLVFENYGYKINKTRDLNQFNYFSDEIIHIGGASNFSEPNMEKFPEFPKWKNLSRYLMVSYLILSQYSDVLPAKYRAQEKTVMIRLARLGIKTDLIEQMVYRAFSDMGICSETIERLLK